MLIVQQEYRINSIQSSHPTNKRFNGQDRSNFKPTIKQIYK